MLLSVLGECITSVGSMCALNSIAEECAVNLTAPTKCSCIDGYQQVVGDNLVCIGKCSSSYYYTVTIMMLKQLMHDFQLIIMIVTTYELKDNTGIGLLWPSEIDLLRGCLITEDYCFLCYNRR